MNKCDYAIIISGLAILIACCAAFPLPFDCQSASFVVGVLSLLVTVLVAWQIYNTIDFKKRIDKIEKRMIVLEKDVKTKANTVLFVSLAQLGRSAYNKINKNSVTGNMERADAIQSLLNALCLWDKEMNTPIAKEAYDYCTSKLLILIKDIEFEVEYAEEKDTYVMAAMKTNLRELIDFTTSITIKG